MATSKNTTTLYFIIAVLVMFLAASIGYNIGNGNSNSDVTTANGINAKVLKEIEELKTIYDSKIAEKKASYKDLQIEKEKVQFLLAELEQTKGNANSLLKYKDQYQELESKMRLLVDEIVVLKSNKSKAVTKVQTTKPIVAETKKPVLDNPPLSIKAPIKAKPTIKKDDKAIKSATVNSNVDQSKLKVETSNPKVEIPEKKIEKVYANLNVLNLKSGGYISKASNNHEETNLASKTDLIKISFAVEANPDAKADERKYYIQVVNGANKVIGRRITEFFDDRSITYSISKAIQYENKFVPITQELIAEAFEKGTYTVNVYERSRLVAKTTFTLK